MKRITLRGASLALAAIVGAADGAMLFQARTAPCLSTVTDGDLQKLFGGQLCYTDPIYGSCPGQGQTGCADVLCTETMMQGVYSCPSSRRDRVGSITYNSAPGCQTANSGQPGNVNCSSSPLYCTITEYCKTGLLCRWNGTYWRCDLNNRIETDPQVKYSATGDACIGADSTAGLTAPRREKWLATALAQNGAGYSPFPE